MRAITHVVIYTSRKDIFKLYPLGDIHAGTVYFQEDEFKKQVRTIEKDPLALWVGMGDYADLVTPKDKRWEAHTISDWVKLDNLAESQCQYVEKLFRPIRNKCIGLLGGNHEDSIRKWNHYNFMVNLCERLDVPYLTYSAFVRLVFKRQAADGTPGGTKTLFTCHFTHGSGCPMTEGGVAMNLKRSMDDFSGDIYGKGHIHRIKVMEKPYLYASSQNPPRIKQRSKCGAISGCWFLTYKQEEPGGEILESSYGEQKGYPPTPIGCPVFLIHPDKEAVTVLSNSNMMLERLQQLQLEMFQEDSE